MKEEKKNGKVRTLRLDRLTRDFVDFLLCEYDDRKKAERYLFVRGYIEPDEQLYEISHGIGEDGFTEEARKLKVVRVPGYSCSCVPDGGLHLH